jgi:hypothetical protein
MSNLQEAYEAIEQGDLVTAQAIAAELLKTDQQNAEVWFILSEATEGDRRIIFLNKAIKLDPNLTVAQERLAELQRPPEPEPVLPAVDFEQFGAPEPEPEFKVSKDWQEALRKPLPDVVPKAKPALVVEPEPEPEPAAVSSKPAKVTPTEPSQLFNTLGIGVSLMLAVIMLVLFIQALMAAF